MIKNRAYTALLISAIVFSFGFFSALRPLLFNATYDFFMSLKTKEIKDDSVVIIGIDDKALAAYDKTNAGVIPRKIYADFIKKMSAYGPAAIAFDIIFDLNMPDTAESELVKSMSDFGGKLILASYFKVNNDIFSKYEDSAEYIAPYRGVLPSNASFGYVNIFRNVREDYDGVRRRFKPFVEHSENIIYSFPAAIVKSIFKIEINNDFSKLVIKNLNEADKIDVSVSDGNSSLDVSDGNSFINYMGGLDTFNVVRFSDIIEASETDGKKFKMIFEKKIAIVGSITPVHKDIHDAPPSKFNLWNPKNKEYGVAIAANIVRGLILNKNIRCPGAYIEGMANFTACFASSYLFLSLNAFIASFIAAILVIFVLLCLLFWLFITNGLMTNFLLSSVMIAASCFICAGYGYYSVRRKSRRLESTLSKYVSPEVAKLISAEEFEKSSQGAKKNVTILFSDIRGFTSMSERLDPTEITSMLNEYFDLMTKVIFKNKGTIDKFIGDAIMVIFGAPVEQIDAPMLAIKTAFEMRSELESLKRKWISESKNETINIGIGINTGEAFVGTIGSANHKEYTAIGDTVNTAARLESIAKAGQVLISENVLKFAQKNIAVKALDPVTLKGKNEKVNIYEIEKILS